MLNFKKYTKIERRFPIMKNYFILIVIIIKNSLIVGKYLVEII